MNARGLGRQKSSKTEDAQTKISKSLSYILRHGAEKEGIEMGSDGFILLSDILAKPNFKGVTIAQIESIVENNDKQRFKLETRINPKTNQEALYIRANQGHTITNVKADELLKPVTDISQLSSLWTVSPVMVHGTYKANWDPIKKTGLSRMSRQHIHFAIGEPDKDQVISGMRKTCDIYIYVDIKKLLHDKIPIYISDNNVLLSPGVGDTGIIPQTYFKKVIDVRQNKLLWPEK
jgi:RNA:NAD 2'-phosphotransferase (TPT1/KptA family)